MAKITIGGKQVTVDDGFLDLPDAEKDAIVEDIYSDMKANGAFGDTELAPNPVASTLPGPLGAFQDFSRSFQSGANQGMTLGFGDELQAGLFAIPEAIGGAIQGKGFDIGQGYNTALERVRSIDEASAALNPVANVVGNVTGNALLASRLPSFSKGAQPTIGSMAARGAADGLIYGALTGFGTGEELSDRAQQAVSGGAIGAGLGGIAGSVAGALANKSVAAATPEAQELFDEADALYEAAKNSNVVFPQAQVKSVADDIASRVITEGIDPDLHPGATAALRRLQVAAEGNLTARDAHTIRRVLAAARGDISNPDQARIAGIMTREFDQLLSGAIPDFAQANAVNTIAHKAQTIEQTIQKARDMSAANYSASGFENALRQQFKNLLTSRTALRGFTDEEVAAIRKVAEGGPIENVLRWVGKLAPTGVVSGGLAGGAGYALGGVPGAAAVLGTGIAARGGATASTLNNANLARALIAGGGSIPSVSNPVAIALVNSPAAFGGLGGSEGNSLVARALYGQ